MVFDTRPTQPALSDGMPCDLSDWLNEKPKRRGLGTRSRLESSQRARIPAPSKCRWDEATATAVNWTSRHVPATQFRRRHKAARWVTNTRLWQKKQGWPAVYLLEIS